MPGIDLSGVAFTPASPRLATVKLIATTIGHLIWLAAFSVPLILKLTGPWAGMAAWVAWGLPAVVVVSWIVDLILIPRRVRAMGWAERCLLYTSDAADE